MKFKYNLKTSKRFDKKLVSAVVAGIALLIIILGWVGVRQWYNYNLQPVTSTYSEQISVIVPGSSTVVIGDQLAGEGLIRSSRVFGWYVNRLEEKGYLQAGTYRLSPSYSTQEIVDILLNGRVDTSLVRISPGLRLDQISKQLIDGGFSESEVEAAIKANYTHPLFKDKPTDSSLEGYIFPETYQITENSTAKSVIEHSFDVFYNQLTNEIMSGISRQGLNLYEAITLASIVQEEVSDAETKRQVAQVFLKRLKDGIVLGADPTFVYAATVAGDEPTVGYDSPYNTRIYGGLPPGPIANFNLSALEAVANPASGDYLYFVAGDDGNTYFSKTLAEHEANTRKYCIELCKLYQ